MYNPKKIGPVRLVKITFGCYSVKKRKYKDPKWALAMVDQGFDLT